jgi:hypothetical protein
LNGSVTSTGASTSATTIAGEEVSVMSERPSVAYFNA